MPVGFPAIETVLYTAGGVGHMGESTQETAAGTKQVHAAGKHKAGSQNGFWSQLSVELVNLDLDAEEGASHLASVSAPIIGLGGADFPFQSQILGNST